MNKQAKLKQVIREEIVHQNFAQQIQSDEGHSIYGKFLDYMLFADDPHYKTLRKFWIAINKLQNKSDKNLLIQKFKDETKVENPAVHFKDPW